MYKRACAGILLLMLAMMITSCGNANDANDDTAEPTAPTEATTPQYTVQDAEQPYEQNEPNDDINEPPYYETYEPQDIVFHVPDFADYAQELAARAYLWASGLAYEQNNADRITEMNDRVIFYDDRLRMRFNYTVVGDAPENGHALFIAMHGGGGVPMHINESQWQHMQVYYLYGVREGIYVATRGIRDTWHTHFNDESFPLYDRLIENFMLLYNIDPNRIYLMGFSAGGDGVYAIAPRMADRFAAASMSAGHHNGVNPLNLKHVPMLLQCGDHDIAFNRHIETVNFGESLMALDYEVEVFMHVGMPHNFVDNSPTGALQRVWADPIAWRDTGTSDIVERDTNAVRFLERFTRNPLPRDLVWHLGTRAPYRQVESFYWLRACHSVNEGVIRATLHDNRIVIETESVYGSFDILLNRQMVDFDLPVIVEKNGTVHTFYVVSCADTLLETTLERMDPNFQFTAVIQF